MVYIHTDISQHISQSVCITDLVFCCCIVVPWLHGCGRAAVSATIIAHPEIWANAKLDWQKFILFHGPVFIDALRAALRVAEKEQTRYYEACDRKSFSGTMSSEWSTWTSRLQGKQRKHMTNAFQLLLERSEGHGLSHDIIKLVAEFPIYYCNGRPPYCDVERWRYDYPVASNPSTLTWYGRQLPVFITNRFGMYCVHCHICYHPSCLIPSCLRCSLYDDVIMR